MFVMQNVKRERGRRRGALQMWTGEFKGFNRGEKNRERLELREERVRKVKEGMIERQQEREKQWDRNRKIMGKRHNDI